MQYLKKKYKFNQKHLGEIIGYATSTISQILNDKYENLTKKGDLTTLKLKRFCQRAELVVIQDLCDCKRDKTDKDFVAEIFGPNGTVNEALEFLMLQPPFGEKKTRILAKACELSLSCATSKADQNSLRCNTRSLFQTQQETKLCAPSLASPYSDQSQDETRLCEELHMDSFCCDLDPGNLQYKDCSEIRSITPDLSQAVCAYDYPFSPHPSQGTPLRRSPPPRPSTRLVKLNSFHDFYETEMNTYNEDPLELFSPTSDLSEPASSPVIDDYE